MHVAVRRDEVCGRRVEGRPVHAGHAPARLLDDERARGDVPRLQVLLPEALRSGLPRRNRGRAPPSRAAARRAPGRETRRTDPPALRRSAGARRRGSRSPAANRAASDVPDTASRWPFRYAPSPRSAVNSSPRLGSYTAPTSRAAVDFEAERRAVDRQPVRVVRRAVERVEHPAIRATATGPPAIRRAPPRGCRGRETARRAPRGTCVRTRDRSR